MPRSLEMRWLQLRKLVRGLRSARGRQALRAGVAATGEHQALLTRLAPATVVDIGANRGQFALDVETVLSETRVYSFEPMENAVEVYRKVFAGNDRFTVAQVAIGAGDGTADLHVSKHDDSSSLLAIGDRQVALFPGTSEDAVAAVPVTTIDNALSGETLSEPALIKIDVQGFELEVLRGATKTLGSIRWIYVECSFIELYIGQPLAHEVIEWLRQHDFDLVGIGAISEVDQQVIQADLLFERAAPTATNTV